MWPSWTRCHHSSPRAGKQIDRVSSFLPLPRYLPRPLPQLLLLDGLDSTKVTVPRGGASVVKCSDPDVVISPKNIIMKLVSFTYRLERSSLTFLPRTQLSRLLPKPSLSLELNHVYLLREHIAPCHTCR